MRLQDKSFLTKEEKEILIGMVMALGSAADLATTTHELISAIDRLNGNIHARMVSYEREIRHKESLAYKALSIIEHIASHEQIDREHTWLVYEAAHVALGDCRADHSEWVAKIEGLYNKLKQEKRL